MELLGWLLGVAALVAGLLTLIKLVLYALVALEIHDDTRKKG
jgi:hypothetical protein